MIEHEPPETIVTGVTLGTMGMFEEVGRGIYGLYGRTVEGY
jgi:hypothetical protein